MKTEMFTKVKPAWLVSEDIDARCEPIALMSGVKIRRNIAGFPFPNRCGRVELFDSAAQILGGVGKNCLTKRCDFTAVDALDSATRNLLLETGMMTPKLANGGSGRFLVADEEGAISCMVNEEDHFSVRITSPGLEFGTLAKQMAAVEASVGIDFAQDAVLGYLTANPDYVGTGMQATTLLHLPALDANDDIQRVQSLFERDWKKLTFGRALGSDNTACGSFFTVANRTTLGITPEELVHLVGDATHSIVSKELFARHKMQHTKNADIKDRFWRAWGLLRHARKLSFAEAVNKFSFVKLGADLGILPRIQDGEWRRMLFASQKYHLHASSGRILEPAEEPFIRASLYRQFIEEKSFDVA